MRDNLRRLWPPTRRALHAIGSSIWRALVKYDETDGEQRAASFAYYAFFSIFPLILLLISVGAWFMQGDQERASREIIGFLDEFMPVQAGEANFVINTISDIVKSRRSAGLIAFGALAWGAIRFFQALVRGVNKAWGTKEYSWWHLPIQNLFMVGILASALLLGIIAPVVVDQVERFYWQNSRTFGLEFGFVHHLFQFCRYLVPPLVLFYGFSMFYKFAPRRRTKFREVWIPSLLVTFGLQGLKSVFLWYTTSISDFKTLYGAFGSVVALLMWIYLSGSVIILGGCLCAAIWEIRMHMSDQSERSTAP